MCKSAAQCGNSLAANFVEGRIKSAESMVSMEFSNRTGWNTEESDLAAAHLPKRRSGIEMPDVFASQARVGLKKRA
jgi:hypothetical protein